MPRASRHEGYYYPSLSFDVGRSRAHSRVFNFIVNQKQSLCDFKLLRIIEIIASVLESIMLPRKMGSIILPFWQNYG